MAKATHILAGAYSNHYQAIEKQHVEHLKQLAENESLDAIARSKKLTLETNKRRKAQAEKRKQEADKEEKRRKLILQKRRETQREATEKYQRSHIPASHKHQNFHQYGNTSPARALDEALKIVRRSSSATRHNSARARSPRRTHSRENSDPLNRPYVNKYAVNNRPASPSSPKGRDPNKLHNNSLKNLNNSKSLFEQQLEQQQQFLIEQHQRALQEFNVEINSDREVLPADQQYEQSNGLERSESLSSVDSLEGSGSQDSLQQSCDLSYSHIEKAGNNVINENYVTGNDTKQVMPEHVKFITNGNGGWSYTNTKNALQNGANYTKDISGKIDSFNVNTSGKTTQEVPPNNASFQQTFGQQKEVDSRPKVQARAWVTPSPAEQDQNKSNNMYGAQNLVTKSSPYSSRSTLTSVTTTTAYSKGNSVQSPQQYTQSNGWNDEVSNLKQQYITGQQQDTTLQQQNDISVKQNTSKNMEFLESVANQNEGQQIFKPEPPPARVPRPVSAHRSTLNTVSFVNGGHVYRQPLQMTNSTTKQQPQSTASSNSTANSNIPVYTAPSNLSNKPLAVTSPKATVGIVNGKLAVLPDKPSAPITNVVDNSKRERNNHASVMKSKDDSVIATAKSEFPGVKGILKRPGSKNVAGGTLRKAGSTGNMSNVRDSIELTKTQIRQDLEKPKKKSVRFSEFNDYAEHYGHDEREDDTMDEGILFTRRIRVPSTMTQKPPRPVSAKTTTQTAKVDPQIRIPRVASAGTARTMLTSQQLHKSTIRPQAAAHIITHNSGSTYENNENLGMEKKTTVINNNFMEKVPITQYSPNQNNIIHAYNVQSPQYSSPQNQYNYQNQYNGFHNNTQNQDQYNGFIGKENSNPAISNSPPSTSLVNGNKYNNVVYDENGLRIDRTPTDEEINFLWDKVRTCLNRSSTAMEATQRTQNYLNDQSVLSRQPAQLSQTLIDGSALGQLNTMTTRVGPSYTQPYINQSPSQTRTKNGGNASQQNNGYSQRYSLLQQRQKQNPNSLNKSNAQQQRQYISYHVPAPGTSMKEPQQITQNYQPPADASESLAAFMAAEHLTAQQQSVSESQIHTAMDEAQNKQKAVIASKPAQKVPTALSIEEQRLIESLDRLNDKLKITEFPDNLPANPPQTIVYEEDHIPPSSGGFRGSKPLMSQQRQRPSSDTTRNNMRVTSAHGPRTQGFRYS